jgi:C4-dicarboxylate-specific signal transduction histidine kinase
MKGRAVILLLFMWLAPSAVASAARNVLVIYSDDRILPANQELDRAFNVLLAESAGAPVDVYSEFLDRARFSSGAHEAGLRRYLREKYSAQPPSVIVVAGTYALQLLLDRQPFAGVPTVIVGVTSSRLETMPRLPAGFVTIPIEYDMIGTIEQALQLQPDTKKIVVVTGADAIGPGDEEQLRFDAAALRDRYAMEFLSGLPTATLLQKVARLTPHSIVFTPGYFTDGAGRHFSPREAVSQIAAVANAPVYGPYDTFIGSGIVGGMMPSFAEAGRQAAAAVVSLLDGTPPDALSLPAKTPARLQVDWRQVQRWGIAEDRIPSDAIIQFRTPTFWEAYGYIVLIAAAIIALQTALIAALLYERRLQRRTAAALQATERRMVLAARTAQLSNWIWSLAADAPKHTNGSSEQPYVPLSKEPPVVPLDSVLESTHAADRDVLESAVRRAADNHEEFNAEYRVVQRGGVRWLRARGRVEPDDATRMRGVAIDITQAKEAELQAERDRTALGHITRVSLLGQLSAAIAHQLNQPLASILSNAEAARKLLRRDDIDRQEMIEIVDDVIAEDQRAAQVIRRLSALYKNGGRDVSGVDVNDLVRETLELLKSNLASGQVIVVTDLAPALPSLEAERVQLQQVLLNLIVNAADAMAETEEQQRTLTIRTRSTERGIRVDVEDRGPGIAVSDLDHVFDMFFSTKPGGMGVGLAICKSIVAAHRGSLTVRNNADGGATFSIVIPAQQT